MIVGGLDGGGTKLDCCLVSDDGTLLGAGRGGPVNRNFAPEERIRHSFAEALEAARSAAGVSADMVAWTVVGSPTPSPLADSLIRSAFPQTRVLRVGEGDLVLAAAGFVCRGVAVIAGTGSLALAKDPAGGRASVGGWGTLLGDDGSAYDIAVMALRAVARARDGRLPPTGLTEAVCAWARIEDARELPSVIYGSEAPDRTEIAGLAVRVAELASRGDRVARDILRAAGLALAEQAWVAGDRVGFRPDEFVPVYASGGILATCDLVLADLSDALKALAPAWRVARPLVSPAVGAAALALEAAGVPRPQIDRLWSNRHHEAR